MFLVPRVFGLFGQLSDAHVFCKQIPVSQSLSWPRWPDQKARRMWRGDCFVLRNERRTSKQMTGSVGMKKRKNENFNTTVSPPRFCSLSTVDVQKLLTLLAQHVWSCCVRLHVYKRLTGFKLCPTTCNRVGVQTDATCDIQQCWELLANNVASVCMGL